jgi:hypothetical protein
MILVPTRVKFNFNHVYISSWIPFHCKPVFKGEFYPKFVAFCNTLIKTTIFII